VVIGAMTPHGKVATSAAVAEAIPALADLAGLIGDPAVRARGTIGGSIANNDPAADYPAAALALGATIITNKRRMAADEFFTGLFDTALEEGEIVTKVSFPIPSKAGYVKFPNPASRYALVGVFIAKKGAGVRVAVTGAGSEACFATARRRRPCPSVSRPKRSTASPFRPRASMVTFTPAPSIVPISSTC